MTLGAYLAFLLRLMSGPSTAPLTGPPPGRDSECAPDDSGGMCGVGGGSESQ